jgi:RNA polymerase sigma factor (sigma-70 family)
MRRAVTEAEPGSAVYSYGSPLELSPFPSSSMWRNVSRHERFEELLLPHLDAAFNLARWLTRSDTDAQDVVQEAYLRALRYFSGFHGDDARTWLLRIVRNSCYTWLRQHRSSDLTAAFNEEIHTSSAQEEATPESLMMQSADRALLMEALEQLPVEWRETIILRELEGLPYREIAAVTDCPIGTVMSRLARARARLQEIVAKAAQAPRSKEARHGM